MVAPSFKKLYNGSEPYTKGDKQYVKLTSGREVRWYSVAEYNKKWPDQAVDNSEEVNDSQKHLLGFDEGYIWIITKSDADKYYNWLWNHASTSVRRKWRRNGYTDWYLPGYAPDEDEPQEPIAPFPLIKLTWEEISKDNKLLSIDEVNKICDIRRK